MSNSDQHDRRDGAEDDATTTSGGEARPTGLRVPVIAVRDELAPAITLAAGRHHAATVRVSAAQLAQRWSSAAVVVLDEPAAAALRERHGFFAPRDGKPTLLLYSGRLVDMDPADVAALWEAADALEATAVLPHGDWLDEPVYQGWCHLLGALLALGSAPLGCDEHDHGAGR